MEDLLPENALFLKEIIHLKNRIIELQEQLIKERQLKLAYISKPGKAKKANVPLDNSILIPQNQWYEEIGRYVVESMKNKNTDESRSIREWIKDAMYLTETDEILS